MLKINNKMNIKYQKQSIYTDLTQIKVEISLQHTKQYH